MKFCTHARDTLGRVIGYISGILVTVYSSGKHCSKNWLKIFEDFRETSAAVFKYGEIYVRI